VLENFKVITLSGAAGRQVGAYAPECRPWRRINKLYSVIYKTSVSAKI